MLSLPAREEWDVERGWMNPRGIGITIVSLKSGADEGKGPQMGDRPRRGSDIAASPPGPGKRPPRRRAKENTGNPIPSPRRRGPGVYPGSKPGRTGGPRADSRFHRPPAFPSAAWRWCWEPCCWRRAPRSHRGCRLPATWLVRCWRPTGRS